MHLGAIQRTKFVTNVQLVGEARAWSLMLQQQHHVRPVFLEPPGMMELSLGVNCVTTAVVRVLIGLELAQIQRCRHVPFALLFLAVIGPKQYVQLLLISIV